ncbi:MAG: metallophosphoesterase [Planctomycetia bacterium]|nr:metallophosphoesterase [Planctomycetia bacterium]
MFRKVTSFLILLAAASIVACLSVQAQQSTPGQYVEPALEYDGGWSMIVIPDPQAYTRYGRNHGIYDLMTAWVAESVEKLNIKEVVCVGDLVESNNLQYPDGKFANQTSKQMWEMTSRAFSRLDGVCQYIVTTGNHDYGPYIYPDGNHYGTRSSLNRETQFNDYFPIDRNPLWKESLVETFENAYGYKSLENAAYQIEGTDGQRVLLVVVEFAPREEALAWAKSVFERPENQDAFGILVTHSYLRPYTKDCQRDPKEGYGLNEAGGCAGEQIWEKLVYPTANIRMVLCGHHSTADNMDGCTGFRVDANAAGKSVSQLLCDMQAMGGGWEGNGGDGWLQILEFSKDMKKCKLRTFSPLFAISPVTREHAWYTAEKQNFEFDIE